MWWARNTSLRTSLQWQGAREVHPPRRAFPPSSPATGNRQTTFRLSGRGAAQSCTSWRDRAASAPSRRCCQVAHPTDVLEDVCCRYTHCMPWCVWIWFMYKQWLTVWSVSVSVPCSCRSPMKANTCLSRDSCRNPICKNLGKFKIFLARCFSSSRFDGCELPADRRRFAAYQSCSKIFAAANFGDYRRAAADSCEIWCFSKVNSGSSPK